MFIVDGKKIAGEIIQELKKLPKPDKMLAAVLVGDNSQSKSFLKQKEKMAEQLGIAFHLYQYDESITEDGLIKEIKKLGDDEQIGGIIVQLPLPAHYNRDRILAAINLNKDIDALTPESRKFVDPLPVAVVKDILLTFNFKLSTSIIAVVGRGFLVGKPIMDWLAGAGVKYSLFHSKSDLSEIKKADLVITGVGKAGLIKPEMLKSGAGVIDFGYDFKKESGIRNRELGNKIFGDFDVSNIHNSSFIIHNSGFYTSTPGGTGPILVAEIFKNFYKLNSFKISD